MRASISAMTTLLLLGGCALETTDLLPFPCPTNRQCPDGLSCLDDGGCGHPELYSSCKGFTAKTETTPEVPSTNCADAGLSCAFGMCTKGCSKSADCGVGAVCVNNECLPDCTSKPCPGDASCRKTFEANGAKVCVRDETMFSACAGFDTQAQCESVSCPNASGPRCAAGNCPLHGICTNNSVGKCDCEYGFAPRMCNGAACNNNCTANTWSCFPNWSETCTGTSVGFVRGLCRCKDGRSFSRSCSDNFSCEDKCRAP